MDTNTYVNVFLRYPVNGYVTGIPYTRRSDLVPGRPAQRKREKGNDWISAPLLRKAMTSYCFYVESLGINTAQVVYNIYLIEDTNHRVAHCTIHITNRHITTYLSTRSLFFSTSSQVDPCLAYIIHSRLIMA